MDTTSLVILVAIIGITAFLGIKFYGRIAAYLEEVMAEMRKVNWPKRKELISNTIITLLASVALALFIFGSDRVISVILDFIYS